MSGRLDVKAIIGPRCPICDKTDCWRMITPYRRRVVDYFPYRDEVVEIPRFLCGRTGATFSLLHWQIAPYQLYTIRSMLFILTVTYEILRDKGRGLERALDEAAEDRTIERWSFSRWLELVLKGLSAAHHVLEERYDLGAVRTGKSFMERLGCMYAYGKAFASRGPPGLWEYLDTAVQWYAEVSGRHLVGVPSQERRRGASCVQ
jgi:hypothetical protein